MLPSAGGDYVFLRNAYGRGVAFLFAWARAIINTGSLALLGFVLGDYANATSGRWARMARPGMRR